MVANLLIGLREGLETAAIMWSTVTGAYTPGPFVGATLGIVISVILGYLIYRGALKINLSQFFTVTGALLIVVAAGVLAYGVFDLQEARVLSGVSLLAFDVTTVIPPDSWYGTFLKGTINFQPNPSWRQVGVWLAFIIPVLALYLRPQSKTPRSVSA